MFSRCPFLPLMLLSIALLAGCEEDTRVTFLSWSPDGRFVGYIMNGDVVVQEAKGEKPPRKLASSMPVAEDWFSWDPDSRFIVYATKSKGSWDLWMVSIETGRPQQLTSHLAKDWGPAVSPDGKSVLFLSDRGRQIDIWKLDLTTRELKEITHDGLEEYNIRFAKTPGQFLYLARRNPVPPEPDSKLPAVELHRVDLADESNRVIAEFPSTDVAVEVQSSGRLLAAITPDSVSVMAADRRHEAGQVAASYGSERRLNNVLERVSWLCDEDALIYAGGSSVMRSSTRRLRGRPDALVTMPTSVLIVAASPDGTSFAAVLAPPQGKGQIKPHPGILVSDLEGRRMRWLGTPAQLATAALVLSDLGRFREQKDILLRIRGTVEESVEPALNRELARVETKLGNYEEAVSLYRERLNDPRSAARVAFFYMRDDELAEKLFDEVPDGGDDLHLATLRLRDPKLNETVAWAERYLLEGDVKGAVKYHLRVLERFPDSPLKKHYAFAVADLVDTRLHDSRSALKYYLSAASSFTDDPRAASALLRAGDLCRFKLERPDQAIGCYRQAEAGSREDSQRLEACVRQVDFYVNLEPATGRALEVVREFCMRPPADKALRIRAVIDMVDVFDRSQKHENGNRALALLLENLDVEASDLVELLSVPGLSRSRIFEQVLLRADFALLPDWFNARIDVLRPRVDPKYRYIADLFDVLRCRDLDEIVAFREKYLKDHAARLQELPERREAAKLIEALFHYVIGNRLQTRGDLHEALEHYEAFCRIDDELGSGRFRAYAETLKEYRNLPSDEDEALTAYMMVEREAAASFWGDVVSLGQLLRFEGGPAADGSSSSREDARRLYLSFMETFPKSALKADARFRIAELSSGTQRLKWYEYALAHGAGSRFFEQALADYSDAAIALGFTWRAARTCQDLGAELTDPEKLAAVRLQNGLIYEVHLDRHDLALPLYDRVADGSAKLGPWAEAQQRAGLIEFVQKDYAKALVRFRKLREDRPDYAWVKSGECLYYVGRCEESLSNWKEAQEAYLELIDAHRDNSRVADGKLLLDIFGRIDEATRRELYRKHPEDVRKILPALDAWEQEKLLRLIPELRR